MKLESNKGELIAADSTITVCDRCLRACCYQGEFVCDQAQHAGTIEKTFDELDKLNLEHFTFWA